MLSEQQNNLLTRTGRGEPAGEVLRHYWTPAALSDELEGERPVVSVSLMGEELVLFRDESGAPGLIQRHCPHRGADLCYGRLENGGLRCLFHGWLFDRNGQCLEQPAEPEGSQMHTRVKARSYPVVEKNGVFFAYLGTGTPPAFPELDCFRAPSSHVFAFKGLWRCNWLQALEVGIDPAHASFLHRFLEDDDPADSYGKQFRDSIDTDTGFRNIPMTRLLREYPRPEIVIEDSDSGFRLQSLRRLDNKTSHVRVTNHIFPCAISIPMSRTMTITQWHVPIDDKSCYWYAMFTSFSEPVDKQLMRQQRLEEHTLPEYQPVKNADNRYHYSPQEQQNHTYTGMGQDINVHDQWACESMGSIQDRTEEHLGKSDVGIIHYRRLLRAALSLVENNKLENLPFRPDADHAVEIRGPMAIDTITGESDWKTAWRTAEHQRRQQASWHADVQSGGLDMLEKATGNAD